MESQGLRDVDRWKDKIEVRLDNRQVAFLFFGSALVACMLFILGVVVGKRLESRGRAMAPEIEDPLALLDRVAASAPTEPEVEAAAGMAPGGGSSARAPRPRAAASTPSPTSPKVAPPRPAPEAAAAGIEAAPSPPPGEAEPSTPAAQSPRTAAQTAAGAAAGEKIPAPGSDKVETGSVDVARSEPAPGEKARFMLQIGAFADRAEAEAFAATFADEAPSIVSAEIPGKGVWFRVRFGSYAVFKDAVAAKMAFEKRHNKIALVVGPL